MIGRPAEGPAVELTFQGCPDAADIVVARAADMGLSPTLRPSTGGFIVALTLPTADTDTGPLADVLATTGLFTLRAGDLVLATQDHIVSAGVRLDMTMSPSTLIVIEPAARDRAYTHMNGNPEGKLQIELDGVEVWNFSNRKPSMHGEFEIPPDAKDDRARMELAAGRGIYLNNGPLPCPVSATIRP
jgi:hypothetical protein